MTHDPLFSTARPPVPPTSHPGRWPAMAVLLTASFMNLLDVSILNVALPSLQADLQADERQLQWVIEIYVLVFALGLLPLGRLGDIVGRKAMFVSGVAVFTLASALCGFAPDAPMLLAARTLQGLGAAMLSPQVMAIAQTLFAPKERAAAFSLFGVVAGAAAIAGPLAGGVLLHADLFGLGWRPVFLVNLPIGLAVLLAAWRRMPHCPPHPGLKNDWPGIGLAAAAILCLVYPLVEARAHGWPAWAFALMAASLPLAAAFVAWEHGRAKRGGSALLPIHVMAHRDYRLGSVAIMVFFSGLQSFFLIFALFLQQGLQFSPLQTGMATAPFPLGVLLATGVAGRLQDLRGKVIGGAVLLGAAFVGLALMLPGVSAASGTPAFMLPMAVGGVGAGVCIASLFQAVMRTVPLKDAGSGSGAVQVIQQLGTALGVALVSSMFFGGIERHAAAGHAAQAAYIASFQHTLLYQIGACGVVVLMALAMTFEQPSASMRPGMPSMEGPGRAPREQA